jgi:transcriptional regulator with XRE-family HTH domain
MTQTRTKGRKVETPTPTDIARARIQRLRKRKGWTQRELAERLEAEGFELGIDRDVVANFESGRRRSLSVDELVAFAAVLDVSPVDLIVRDAAGMRVGKWTIGAVLAGQWVRGDRPLPSQDVEAWQEDRSEVRSGPGRFVTPAELANVLRHAGLEVRHRNDLEPVPANDEEGGDDGER